MPELTNWTGPYGLPRFDLITDSDFEAAFAAALVQAEAAYGAIAANAAQPDFDNTVAAMEGASRDLDRVAAVFFTLSAVDSNPAREALERDLAPKLAAFAARVGADPRLLARVQAVWDRQADSLPAEDRRITELALRNLRRAGAGLGDTDRAELSGIMQRLAGLTTAFTQNVLRDERDFALTIPDDGLAGLSASLVADLRAAARARGLPGQVLTLSRSLMVPFLEQSTRRDLRQIAHQAWVARGSGQGAGGGETDNAPLIREILGLRHRRAVLLGFPDFASFKLAPEMAGTVERVQQLLMSVWHPALDRVLHDAQDLSRMLHADGGNGDLEAWDWRYYAARRRAGQHQIDEAETRQYFALEAMIEAAFDTAQRLFGLTFQPFDVPLWHPDLRAWQVLRDGREMAVFIADYFARPGKRSGAWCSALRRQHKMAGEQRAIVVNVCNFTPPADAGQPALLSWDDVRTLFHEFGHALHHILSDVRWPSVSGTSVARDFVELPSQLFEHWAEQPEVLDRHARHSVTGAVLPASLRDRIVAAGRSDAGAQTLEYLQSALVDLALHTGAPSDDPMAQTTRILAALDAPSAVPMRHATQHFAHVFSGDGYASGYYSYLWSEVMDADAFAAFAETGDVFDAATARRLEDTILSRGGSAPADQLWTDFRERMPGVDALLIGRGLKDARQNQ